MNVSKERRDVKEAQEVVRTGISQFVGALDVAFMRT
jgi:hypothetical protein